MGWNYEDSEKRIKDHMDNMGEIEVKKLIRESDLETLLIRNTQSTISLFEG